jgi:8-oxo-dGTP diphosphatase/A/G-specific adenine glycosylase
VLRDAFGLEIVVGDRLATVRHEFSHRRLRLHVYACRLVCRTPPHVRRAGRWLSVQELERYPLARVDRKVLAAVMQATAERLPPPVTPRRAR